VRDEIVDDLEVLLRALFETFGITPTAGQIMGYRMALDDVPMSDIERGIRKAMRDSKFMPKPVELRELSGEMPWTTKAALAWGAVKKAIHSHGAYACVDFADPAINAVIRNMGGWVELCGRDAATFETFTRKDFERIYLLLAPGGVDRGAGAYLRGIFEGPPRRIGVPYAAPKALGEADGPRGALTAFVAGLVRE
jgi:hypothetical protein